MELNIVEKPAIKELAVGMACGCLLRPLDVIVDVG